MKNVIVFIIIVLLFCGINLLPIKKFDIANLFSFCGAEVYLSDDDFVEGYVSVKNGTGVIVYCDVSSISYLQQNYEVCGFTIKVNKLDVDEVLTKIKAKDVERVMGYDYGVSPFFNKYIKTNNKTVNFQCVQSEDCVLLGVPLLLGSY